MSNKVLIAAACLLATSVAQAQVRPTPKAPVAPRPVAPIVVPVPVPDVSALADLERQLEPLRSKIDLDLAPAIAMNIGPAIDASALAIDALALAGGLEDLDEWRQTAGQAVWTTGRRGDEESADYERGVSSLDHGRFEQAVKAFEEVIAAGGKRADGALYWKAYALNRLGKGGEALATIDDLLKKHASSRWANDARALQVEVRQASGRPVNPSQESDEELKLIALNGIVMRDPDRGIPLVEQILAGTASPRMKERALFVLAQSGSPRAKTIVVDIAKGKGNPDLQLRALDYLGGFGGGPDVPLLVEVYKATADIDVKKRVIRSLAVAGGRNRVFVGNLGSAYTIGQAFEAEALAKAAVAGEKVRVDAEEVRVLAEKARAEAEAARGEYAEAAKAYAKVRSTGSSEREKAREAKAKEAAEALWGLYLGESVVDLKREILRNMYIGGQPERLIQVARTEKNQDLRRAAIQGLMFSRDAKTTETLLGLYRDEKDLTVKRQIIDSLSGSAAALVQLARQETDPTLRKRLVERLSYMKDKEATDYMVELLKK